jgi:hypothetical protein
MVVTGSWVAGVDAFRVGNVATTNGIAKAIDERIRGDAGNADVMGRRYERSCPTGTPVTVRLRQLRQRPRPEPPGRDGSCYRLAVGPI